MRKPVKNVRMPCGFHPVRRCTTGPSNPPMKNEPESNRLTRLTEAVEAYLEHRASPDGDDEAFLAANDDLRDLLEAMMSDECGESIELGDTHESEGGFDDRNGAPRFLGDYRIVREMGRGGMGVVYEATQVSLGRRVALKVLPAHLTQSPRQIERFRREAAAAAKLQHEGIVPIHAIGSVDGAHFYAMEFVDGRTLHDAIEAYSEDTGFGVLPGASRSAEAAEIAAQVAEALAYSHAAGVVHRDVKPQNILIDQAGKVRLVDFGLAKDLSIDDAAHTTSGAGTPFYMSPEQIDAPGKVDARSDVFALGVVLYEMLTGTRPFDGATTEQVIRAVTSLEVRNLRNDSASVPRDLETICLKALEKKREERYASVGDFGDDLRRFLQHEPIHARPPATAVRLAKLVRRHRALSAALALVVVIATSSAFLISWQSRQQARRDLENMERSEEAILSLIDVALSTTVPRRPGDEQRAVARLGEAASICEALLAQQGGDASLVLRRRFADLLIYMGEFYRQRAEEEKARELHARALRMTRRNLRDDPDSLDSISQHSVAFSHWYGALAPYEREEGLREFDALVERLRELPPCADPERERERQRSIAASLSWRATIRLEARESLSDVRRDLEAADASWSTQRRGVTALSGTGWVMTRLHLARLHHVEGRATEALELIDETWKEFEPVLQRDAQNRSLRAEAANLHGLRSRVLSSIGKQTAAIRASGRAIRLRNDLARDFPRSTENSRLLAVEEIELAKTMLALSRYDQAIELARKALEHIAKVGETIELRQIRATARSNLAMTLMHRADKTSGARSASDDVVREINSLYTAALEEQRELVELAPAASRFAFALAATACNQASWELKRGNVELATTLARESFEHGRLVALRGDPALVAAKKSFRIQSHLLVGCLVQRDRAEDAFEVAGRSIDAQGASAVDFTNAAIQACRAIQALLRRGDSDAEARRRIDLYATTAISWLRHGVELDRRVLEKHLRHPAFSVLRAREDWRELLHQPAAPQRAPASSKPK